MTYRRNRFTWTAFGALFAFGYLNAVLGPSLPYIRSAESISYLVAAARGPVGGHRLARSRSPESLLVLALGTVCCGLPFLLAATSTPAAVAGIVLTGAGIGALFPLTSSLHVQASRASADVALGQILSFAAIGMMAGPLLAGAIAQVGGLRAGLSVTLPTLALLSAAGLVGHRRQIRSRVVPDYHRPAPARGRAG